MPRPILVEIFVEDRSALERLFNISMAKMFAESPVIPPPPRSKQTSDDAGVTIPVFRSWAAACRCRRRGKRASNSEHRQHLAPTHRSLLQLGRFYGTREYPQWFRKRARKRR